MEQAGLYSLILYENKDLGFIYPELDNENLISEITGTNNSYTFSFQYNPIYKQEKVFGKNWDYVYIHTLTCSLWDISITNYDKLDAFRESIYGYIPLLYLNAEGNYNTRLLKILTTPVFLNNDIDLEPVNGHIFNLEFKTKVPTTNDLIEFQNPDAEDWILDTGFWDDGGIWKDTSAWKDSP